MQSPGESINPYENPELLRFTGSMEGIPDVLDPRPVGRGPRRALAHEWLDFAARILPGIAVAGLLAAVAFAATRFVGEDLLGFVRTPIPPVLVAILLGLAIRNSVGLPASYDEGLRFCAQRVLRVGVALLGLRLSLAAVGSIGVAALPIVAASILFALVFVGVVNRSLGLPARLGTLVAVGTAICGNSAIAAIGPAIGAKDDEVSYAVGCVTLFGLCALLVYPFASHAFFGGDPRLAGIFLGTAIHDTAQVAGAGVLYAQYHGAPEALDAAAVTKLLRNCFMLLVIPGTAWLHQRGRSEEGRIATARFSQVVPLFVIAFLALALLRSVGDLGAAPFAGAIAADTWQAWIGSASVLSGWCLALAMAAIGLGTDLGRLRKLGLRPLGVGLAAALGVGVLSAGLIRLFLA